MTAIRLRLEHRGWTLDRVVSRAAELAELAELAGAAEYVVRQRGRRRHQSWARRLVAVFASLHLGCSDSAIARATGVGRRSIERVRARSSDARRDERPDWQTFFGVVD